MTNTPIASINQVGVCKGKEDIRKVIAHFGPVAVAMNGDSLKFRFYSHGKFEDAECGEWRN